MLTINTVSDIKQAGKFMPEERNLYAQLADYKKVMALYKAEKVLIDSDIQDISFFVPFIKI